MSFSDPCGKLRILPQKNDNEIDIDVEKTLEDPSSGCQIASVLYFDHPHNLIVSCDFQCKIRIWCPMTGECRKVLENHLLSVLDLIKLNEDTFISCSDDRTIRFFSISSPNFEQTKIFEMEAQVYQLLKLSEELLLCRCFKSDFFILSLSSSKTKILKKFSVGILKFDDNPLVLSKEHRHSFYAPVSDEHGTIKLIDYEKSEIVKEFKGHVKSHEILSLCLFNNSKGEEILIACSKETIYYFNTSHPQFDTSIALEAIKIEKDIRTRFDYYYTRSACFCLNNQYLVYGDRSGHLKFFEINEHEETIRKMKKLKIHESGICDAKLIPSHFKGQESSEFRILSCSQIDTVKVTKVCGLQFKSRNSYEKQDLEERIRFLVQETERIFFEQEKKFVVEIKISNFLLRISRIFLDH